MRTIRLHLGKLALLAGLATGLAASGGATSAGAATLHTSQIVGFSYSPDPMTVSVGDSVQWFNVAPNTEHDVALFATPGKPFEFLTAVVAPGQTTAPVLMTTAGDYVLQCTIHGTSMRQRLVVSAVPPVEVNEVPLPALLAVSAAVCLGGAGYISRRRRRAST